MILISSRVWNDSGKSGSAGAGPETFKETNCESNANVRVYRPYMANTFVTCS